MTEKKKKGAAGSHSTDASELSDAAQASPNIGGTAAGPMSPKEKTKSTIAIWFVFFFLGIIGLMPAVLLFFHIVEVDDYKDIVLTLAGVLGGPLGIVITNYFKDKEEDL